MSQPGSDMLLFSSSSFCLAGYDLMFAASAPFEWDEGNSCAHSSFNDIPVFSFATTSRLEAASFALDKKRLYIWLHQHQGIETGTQARKRPATLTCIACFPRPRI